MKFNPHRVRIIAIASALALFGALVPILGMLWITWSLAVSDEEARLSSVSERVLARARLATTDAQKAFDELAASDAEACSPRHIALMRRFVFITPSLKELGYFDNGILQCTSWGQIETRIDFVTPDVILQSGLGVTLGVHPLLPGGGTKLALNAGKYNALVDPGRFIDIIADPQIQLALATSDGRVIARTAGADERLVADLARSPRSDVDAKVAYSSVRSGDWLAIAIEPPPQMISTLRREQWMLLPIGLFIAGFIVSIVVWFSRRRLSFQAEIATAIRNEEMVVHYQPIIHLASGKCIGAEALIRWKRPDGTWVRPDLFIPVAEDAGMIEEITTRVIDCVGRDLGLALSQDPSLHVSINLASSDLKTEKLLGRLEQLSRSMNIAPGQIWLEATEHSFIDYETSREVIYQARAAGYRLSIDDFGTGYSSLQHLQMIAFDALKIDKSFVDTIGVTSAKSAVIFDIIEMAKALDVTIIAEGVETQLQADYLRKHGVQYAQGWLFARALPPEAFKDYLATGHR